MNLINISLDDLGIEHHFGGNEYIKVGKFKAGTYLEQHKHKHDHLSVLVSGDADVTVDGETKSYRGFNVINIAAYKAHGVYAKTDCIWLCVWGISEKDVNKIDDGLIYED